jgi:WD40 repeat protein
MHPTAVYCGAISPDGRLVVTGNSQKIGSVGLDLLNDEGGEVRVWDAETGEQLGAAIRLPEPVRAVRFSPGGDSFYTLCYPLLGPPWNSEVRVWDSASRRPRGEPLRMNGQPWHSVTYSADGKLLAVAGLEGITPRIWILDTTTGKSIRPPWTFPVRTLALAFSPDGRILLSGGGHARNSGEARLWDLGTGRLIGKPIVQQEMNTTHVAFSPDGRSFLTWSGYSGQLRHTPQPVEASVERVVLWTQVLTGMELNADGEVKLLDATTWQDRRQLLKLGGPPIP